MLVRHIRKKHDLRFVPLLFGAKPTTSRDGAIRFVRPSGMR